MARQRTSTPRSLYLHVPFCTSKCGYCDFYSIVPKNTAQMSDFGDALRTELATRCQALDPFDTIFVGGGTPTALPEDLLRRLLRDLRTLQAPGVEFTVEANPESCTPALMEVLAEAGVNRLSIGAQSFNPDELKVLDRRHTPGAVERAARAARAVGIDSISIDLIFGIPGQTRASWDFCIRQALERNARQISIYGVTYEPGTPLTERLRRGTIARCDDNLEADLYLAAIERLTDAGFEHYEISNFARKGDRCRHNMTYWRNEPYIGLGPAAAGYLDGRRYRNVSDVDAYARRVRASGTAEAESETLNGAALAREMIMLGLRLIEGVDLDRVAERTGVNIYEYCRKTAEKLENLRLVAINGHRVSLTRNGLLVADSVITEFFDALDTPA